MAKVEIQGHASGTGVLTVTAPNTSTDRTITLPDATGTLATTADTFDPDGAVTINESGANVDFRVESDTNANALLVRGSDGKVGIGSNAVDEAHLLVQASTEIATGTSYNTFGNLHVSTDTQGTDNGGTISMGGLGRNSGPTEYFKYAQLAGRAEAGDGSPKGYLTFETTSGITNLSTERMRIDSNGYVTKSAHPNFWAYSNVGANTAYGTAAEFIMNLEGTSCPHYSTSTGRFTAPVAGFYHFECSIYSYSASKWFTIKKNGSDIVITDTKGVTSATTADHMTQCSLSMDLALNDYVSFGFRNGNSGNIYPAHCWFSGYLVG